MTAPIRTRRDGGYWATSVVLAAAAMSLMLVVDRALVVAAGRHLVARVDAWLARMDVDEVRDLVANRAARGPLVDVDAVRRYAEERSAEDPSAKGAKGAAASETHSDTDPETPAM